MFFHSLYIVFGSLLLFLGAHYLVDGSKNLAIRAGIRPVIVALTFVAFATSAPELFVSLVSTFKKLHGMAIGNIIGSNIANIALVISVAALVKPVRVGRQTLRVDFPVMLLVGVLFYIFSFDQILSRIEGGCLLTLFVIYIAYCVKTAKIEQNPSQKFAPGGRYPDHRRTTDRRGEFSDPLRRKSKLFYCFLILVGSAAIISGADLLVTGGVFWARSFGISDIVIGLTVLAIGTSLPELATSVMAMAKDESDISIGNVVGSNIQNIALVIALIALITPIKIPSISLKTDFPVMLFYSGFLYAIVFWKNSIKRPVGAALLVSYIIYILYLYYRSVWAT